jgi:hypothetical protein
MIKNVDDDDDDHDHVSQGMDSLSFSLAGLTGSCEGKLDNFYFKIDLTNWIPKASREYCTCK